MVHVTTLFPLQELQDEIANGFVRVQTSGSGLSIYNYTEVAAYSKRWNPVTLACRGLILDDDYNIVARPWRKFFNYGEGRLMIDDVMPVEVTDKMDGSLGILYWNDAGPGIGPYLSIATRGSFMSDQALHASRLFNNRYAQGINSLVTVDYTFLMEIIYPENRIVLNYDGMDDLVLLGAVHIERGYYVGPNEAAGLLNWTGPVTTVFSYRNVAEVFAASPRPNAEGLVIRSGTEIVKVKQQDYIDLHRIVTNLSPLTLWRRLSAGDTLTKLLEDIPDEWHEWLRRESKVLVSQYLARIDAVTEEFSAIVGRAVSEHGDFASITRKTWASYIKKSKDKAYMFSLLDNKPVDQMVWAEIRPNGATTDV